MALTIEQFTEQANNENLHAIMGSDIITGSGDVDESTESILCSGDELYSAIWEDPDFNGKFTEADAFAGVVILRSVN